MDDQSTSQAPNSLWKQKQQQTKLSFTAKREFADYPIGNQIINPEIKMEDKKTTSAQIPSSQWNQQQQQQQQARLSQGGKKESTDYPFEEQIINSRTKMDDKKTTSTSSGLQKQQQTKSPPLVMRESTDYSFDEQAMNAETMTLRQLLQFRVQGHFAMLNALTNTKQHRNNCILPIDLQQFNRYCDILPYKHSAVKLAGKTEKEQYINASYINSPLKDRAYIATQGPVPESFSKFWTMVWEQNVEIIFMLCKEKEGTQVKCDRYWPSQGQVFQDGGIVVKQIGQTSNPVGCLTERIFVIENNSVSRQVTHIHWEGWPDYGVPEEKDYNMLIELVQRLLIQVEMDRMPIIHCSAGVGRTGTLIALTNVYMYLKYYQVRKVPAESIQVNVFDIIRRLREQRNLMVQTDDQLRLVFHISKTFAKQLFKI